MENFEKVCVAMRVAKGYEKEVEVVYNILSGANKPMRAKEIAEIYALATGYKRVSFHDVTHKLKWLVSLGLVERIETDGEPLSINYEYYEHLITKDNPYVNEDGYVKVEDINDFHRWNHRCDGQWVTKTHTVIPKIVYFQIRK